VVLHPDQSLEVESRSASGEDRRTVLRGAPGVGLPGATLYILPAGPAADISGSQVHSSLNRSLLFAALFAFGIALLAALALSRYILRPIRAVSAAAGSIAEGRFDERVPVHGRDEIGSLSAAFNAMADRLAHTQELRRSMAGDISHELRTPLTRLLCQVEAMQDGLGPPTQEALRHIHEQVRILERLVDDLHDLSLSDAGQLKLNPAPLRIDEIIRSVAAAQPVVLDVSPNLPPVLADARRIRQILQNLIDHAVRCGPEDATVTISARMQNTGIEIRVRDRGPAIPPEHLALIFERFRRVDDSHARAPGGAGLSLTLVKLLVAAHGGRVWAESAPGEGATVIFTLPTIA
jgi:signal transduction histidine kinase